MSEFEIPNKHFKNPSKRFRLKFHFIFCSLFLIEIKQGLLCNKEFITQEICGNNTCQSNNPSKNFKNPKKCFKNLDYFLFQNSII